MNNIINKEKKSSLYLKLHELFTEKLGIKITPIRLKLFSKVPLDQGWTDPDYDPGAISWARYTGNLGIIPGRSNLLIIDCDTGESIKFFIELANRINLSTETLVVQTRRGAHYYYYCPFSNELEKKQFTNQTQNVKIDVLAGSKCQVVAPYSQLKIDERGQILDAKAKDYFLFVYEPLFIPEKLFEISKDLYNQLLAELEKTLEKTLLQGKKFILKEQREEQRELTDEEIEKLSEIVAEYFQEGQRQNLILYLSGYLRKDLNISSDSVYKLYELLQPVDDQKDERYRLEAIKRSYEKDLDDIAGKSKLEEILSKENAEELCSRIKQVLKAETQRKNSVLNKEVLDQLYQEMLKDDNESTEPHAQEEEDKKDKKKSIFEKVLKLFLKNKENFWLSEYDEAYFSVSKTKHYRIESKRFKEYLQNIAIGHYIQPLHSQAMDNLLAVFQYWARENAEKHKKKYKVFTRVGYSEEENFIEVNLLREDYKVLRISKDKIELDDPKLKFVPSKSQLPLAHFNYEILQDMQKQKLTANEILLLFKNVFNIQTKEELALLLAFLLKTFYEPGEYPILVIQGEREGVGKTTFSKFIAKLLDPTTTLIKSFPRKIDDLFVLAKGNFLLVFDNLSYLDEDMSDALCQLATGGSLSKRKLYTDFEVVDIPLKRPVILNSIFQIAQRRDLRRRSIILELKKPKEIKSLRELQENFNKFAPFLYSYLVLCVQEALKEKIVDVSLLDIADFCEFVAKAHPVFFMSPNEFIATLKANREEAAKEALESNLLVPIILSKLAYGTWQTTAKELLEELKKQYPNERKLSFLNTKQLGRELRKIASDLEALNIKLEFMRAKDKREIVFTRLNTAQSVDELPF